MTIEEQEHAIRHATAFQRADYISCLRLSGAGAFEVLDHLCPVKLYLMDTQILHTLMLDEDASPILDLYVCRDDDDFILLGEGMSADEIIAHIARHSAEARQYEVVDLRQSHQLWSLHGPYAWELLSQLYGPEIVGLPYLSFFQIKNVICFRTGKTGEYGYNLLIPHHVVQPALSRLNEIGSAFDMVEIGMDALDQCALENWFFNIRREGMERLTPLELQLQWRVSYKKKYVGSGRLLELKQKGCAERFTSITSPEPIEIGDTIMYMDHEIGRLVNAGFSHTRDDYVGLALIDINYAHSGINNYEAVNGAGRTRIKTVSPPVINNRSLYVSPQVHSYAARKQFTFPDLAS